ncbi:hypothetical protein B5X24_HaOG214767 [Helicoverpa armigera]|uniref:Uncharacterized protein n=1 Tax=Helicoverpa armigera TaxID=29058 RepID=A0A2W1BGQ6_HELAM|nr:hypothetical protein B5X24_HaOG214767 [Helicoverpa armigera]
MIILTEPLLSSWGARWPQPARRGEASRSLHAVPPAAGNCACLSTCFFYTGYRCSYGGRLHTRPHQTINREPDLTKSINCVLGPS